jgi:hypothetical protein
VAVPLSAPSSKRRIPQEVELSQTEDPAAEMARAIGLRPRRPSPKKGGRTCEDCYFWRHMLCALDLDEPCSTFRADGPNGLVPPRQPTLLVRRAAREGLPKVA